MSDRTKQETAASEYIEIRVTSFERATWEHAASQYGLTLGEWIRARCTYVESLDAPRRKPSECYRCVKPSCSRLYDCNPMSCLDCGSDVRRA